MAHRTISTMDYLIKTQFTPEFNEDFIFFNNKFLEKIYKNRKTAMGSPINGPIRVRRASGSTAAIAEGATHPTAAQPVDYRVTDTLKIIDTHKTTTQLAINLTRSGSLNYRTALADNLEDTVGEHGDFLDRAMFSEAGFMGTLASTGHYSSTIFRMGTGTNMRQFYVGQSVAILVKSDGTTSHGHVGTTIASIGTDAGQSNAYDIEVDDAVSSYSSLDNTFGICCVGNVSGSTNMLPHGLPDLIGTGTLHGVTTTSGNYPEFKAVVIDKASGDVGLTDLQRAIDNVELVSKGTVDFIELSDWLYRIIQFDIADPQIQRAPGQGDVGTGPIRYRGRSNKPIPIFICAFSNPTDDIYLGDSSAIHPYASCFAEWMDDDGKYLTKVSGSRHYETSLGTEIQNLAHFRTRLAKITNCNLS